MFTMGNYGTWHWRTPLFVCAIVGIIIFYCAWHGRAEDLSSQDSLDRNPILRPAYLVQRDNIKIFNGDETTMTITPRAQGGETLPNGTSTERGGTTKPAPPLTTSLKPTVAVGSLVSITTTLSAQISSANGISKTKPGTWENPGPDVRVGHGFQMMEVLWNERLRKYFIEVSIEVTEIENTVMQKKDLVLETGDLIYFVSERGLKENKRARPAGCPPCSTNTTATQDDKTMGSADHPPIPLFTSEASSNISADTASNASGATVAKTRELVKTLSIINFEGSKRMHMKIPVVKNAKDGNTDQYSSLGIGLPNSTFLITLMSRNITNTPSYGLHLGNELRNNEKGSGSIIFGGVDIAKFSVEDLTTHQLLEPGASNGSISQQLNITITTTGAPVTIGSIDTPVRFDFGDPFICLYKGYIDRIKAALTEAEVQIKTEGNDIFLKDLPPPGWGLDLIFYGNRTIFVELMDTLVYSRSQPGEYKYQLMVQDCSSIVLGHPFFRAVYAFLDYENNEISFAPIRRGVTEQHILEVFESLRNPTTVLKNINPANTPPAIPTKAECSTEKNTQLVIRNALAVVFGGLWRHHPGHDEKGPAVLETSHPNLFSWALTGGGWAIVFEIPMATQYNRISTLSN
ncbi:hypothetical protein AOL_s00004g86 [Orbilia oligospora ATCC 24927]|uniref:Peptidase A1 domain-containing protein n=1 Tax=Arthrobotrys oligospora (strain ATCC 24927 / CBS 115.81 / DSM 1491) TaxID=756982 RepID=G1WXS6_ARTOA|nr:hypothetical protein AOL_s00004g86 [Orbilia oligospora ATCC 24927]EGX54053.1 hypothetical protein AOL_s00004g86 [Orbilia oligospora ATCC 24927]